MKKPEQITVSAAAASGHTAQQGGVTNAGAMNQPTADHLRKMLRQISADAEGQTTRNQVFGVRFIHRATACQSLAGLSADQKLISQSRTARGVSREERDLIDHLDPDNPFRLEIGGES